MHIEPWLVREIHPFKDLVAFFRLWAFLRRHRFDVVHLHSVKAVVLGTPAAKLAGVPVILHTLHGVPWNPAQRWPLPQIAAWSERWCARWSDAVVVVAAPDRDEALAHGVGTPDQYVLIRSGIEIEAYRDVPIERAEARRRIGVPAEAFVVGSVARLSPQKAPLDLFTAFEKLARRHPEAHLVMVGDGPLRAEFEAAVARAELGARVHLLGLRRDVPELLRAFDVMALASHYEGLPRVFPQAMAAGLPIVATGVDGAVDAIVPGETGWMVEVGDLEGLATRLLALADDPAAARRMGECGRARVEEFSARRMVRQLEELYARLAVRKGLIRE
jgi:glycosyltransferase involved in cell wall biosynthesis